MGQHSLGFAPALRSGFFEMLNTGGLTGLVAFLLFLFWVARDRGFFWRNTIGFVIGHGVAKVFWIFGAFDGLLDRQGFYLTMAGLYFCFALFCVSVGGWLLQEWKISLRAATPGPVLARKIDEFKADHWGGWKIPVTWRGLGLGLFIALAQTVWGNHETFILIFLQMAAPGREPAGFALFGMYVLVLELPFIFFAALTWSYLKSEKGRQRLRRALTKLQIIFAAIYSGFGLSFLWVYGPRIISSFRP